MAGGLVSANDPAAYFAHQVQSAAGIDYSFLQTKSLQGWKASVYVDYSGGAATHDDISGHVTTYGEGLDLRTYRELTRLSPYIGGGIGIYEISVKDSYGEHSADGFGGKLFAGIETLRGGFLQVFYQATGNVLQANPGGPGLEVGFRF